jgi:hypothetical protein
VRPQGLFVLFDILPERAEEKKGMARARIK